MDLALLIGYTAGLIVLAAFAVHGVVMVVTYNRLRPSDPVAAPLDALATLPRVTVQLPIYNEMHVAARLLDAVCSLDYPNDRLQIQILDDSTDETTAILAATATRWRERGLDVKHVRRQRRDGFKAGALRDGLASASGELIAIFDADFVPDADFLRRVVPHMIGDAAIGMVQTRWEHLNTDYSLLTRVQAMALDAHFAMEQQVRNRSKLFMNFNGTAGVWRRACIEDAGNWQSDTLTEDLDISYRAQLKGWRFLYLNDVTVPAELPAEINALKLQQFRWTKGAIETARKLLGSVWRSDQPLRVKMQATSHLTANLVYPFVLIVALLSVPMVMVKATSPVFSTWFDLLGAFVVASITTMVFYLSAQRDIRSDWRRRMLIYPLFVAGMTGLAVNNSRAVLEALIGRRTDFVRTPKYNIVTRADKWSGSRYRRLGTSGAAIVELIIAMYFVAGIAMAIHFEEFALIPFQLLFLIGFAATGLLSLRHAR